MARLISLLVFLMSVSASSPARALVLWEDALAGRSTEVGLLARAFTFVFAGSVLEPPFLPQEANPSGQAILDLRVSFAHRETNWSFVVHDQLTTRIWSPADLVPARGLSLGRAGMPTRWLPLRWDIADQAGLSLIDELDWLYGSVRFGPVTVTAGRQPITIGRAKIWHPTDLVSMFALTEVDTEYKPGSDAVRVDWQIASRTSLALVGSIGELDDDGDANVSLDGSTFVARFTQGWNRGEVGLLAGFIRWDVVGAVDGTFDVKVADLYGEATVTLVTDHSLTPNHNALCASITDPACRQGGSDRLVPRAVFGATFKPHTSLTVSTELAYDGFGSWKKEDYFALAQSQRVTIGESVVLGRLYMGALADWEVHPLVHLTMVSIVNLRDPSALLSFGVSYDLATDVQLIGGTYLPIGSLPAVEDGQIARPQGEYGLYPYFFFAELKAAI